MYSMQTHRDYVAKASGREDLRRRMIGCARAWAPRLLGSGTDPKIWKPFGLRVIRRSLGPLRGLLHPTSSGYCVAVNSEDHPRIQRFTVAHELAHVLIEGLDRRSIGLSGRDEEVLCDQFASQLLVPRDDLEPMLANFDGDPSILLGLASRYDVGLAAVLRAAGVQLDRNNSLAFVVSRRGHPHRPTEIAHRVRGVLCGPFFMPEDSRLTSLGLISLDSALENDSPGLSGLDEGVSLRLWQPSSSRRSGTAIGRASWTAIRMRNGLAIICLRTDGLTRQWSEPRELLAA
jgi:IrrE N-terminal-like domain